MSGNENMYPTRGRSTIIASTLCNASYICLLQEMEACIQQIHVSSQTIALAHAGIPNLYAHVGAHFGIVNPNVSEHAKRKALRN